MSNIRSFNINDLAAIAEIERQIFHAPWTEEEIYEHIGENISIFIYENYSQIHGYLIVFIDKKNSCFNVLRLAVVPKRRKQGVGTALINKLKSLLCYHLSSIRMDVFESNISGLNFLKNRGFKAVKLIKNYTTIEDGILMEYALSKLSDDDFKKFIKDCEKQKKKNE